MSRGRYYESGSSFLDWYREEPAPWSVGDNPDEFPALPIRRRRFIHRPEETEPPFYSAAIPTIYAAAIAVEMPPHRRPRWFARHHEADEPPVEWRLPSADFLRFYLAGSASDGGVQLDVAASTGGYRSATEVDRVGRRILTGLPGVRLGLASRRNGTGQAAEIGVGSLSVADDDRVAYAAPGSDTPGEPVELELGIEVAVPDGEDASKFIRAVRIAADPLAGGAVIEYPDQFGRLAGMGDHEDPDGSTTYNRFRALFCRAVDPRIYNLRAWVGTMGPVAASDAAHLGVSGDGTLESTDPDAFIGWPQKGWCRIHEADDTWRETVYYDRRTDAVLYVPTLGRACLLSSMAAGELTDLLYSVPPVAIAFESASPLANGPIATAPSDETEPSGMTWNSEIDERFASVAGDLTTAEQVGLRIRRDLPPAIAGFSRYQIKIELAWSCLGVEFREQLGGLFRVGVGDLERLELLVGSGAPPDLDAVPFDTAAALDFSPVDPLADGTYYLVTQRRNRYDLVSRSIDYTVLTVDGDVVANPPRAPELQDLVAMAGGTVAVWAVYFHRLDPQPADTWLVYFADGVDPDPDVDTPVEIPMTYGNAAAALSPYLSDPFAAATEVRCLLRVRRSADGAVSASSEILSIDTTDTTPSDLVGSTFHDGVAEAF